MQRRGNAPPAEDRQMNRLLWVTCLALALSAPADARDGISVSPDGRWIAEGQDTRDVTVWDLSTGRVCGRFQAGEIVSDVAFAPDGRTLLVATYGERIEVRKPDTWKVWKTWRGSRAAGGTLGGYQLDIAPDQFLTSSYSIGRTSDDERLRLWRWPAGKAERLTDVLA